MSALGRYCCKSRKSNDPKNLAEVDLCATPLLLRSSMPLRSSVINFGCSDMVPHIPTGKTHQRLQDFSFDSPKRLLQQYLPGSDKQSGTGNRSSYFCMT